MINKKIKNATASEYNGIKFKSKQEIMCYKTLVENGFNPVYEEESFDISCEFIPTVTFYTKNKFKRKNKNIEVISRHTVKDNRPVESWSYTPDFTFDYKNYHIIIEVKGFQNDLYPYKKKLFRQSLEEMSSNCSITYEFWEIFTKQQLIDCINLLKQKTNENS